jgi:glutamate dehydrogenase
MSQSAQVQKRKLIEGAIKVLGEEGEVGEALSKFAAALFPRRGGGGFGHLFGGGAGLDCARCFRADGRPAVGRCVCAVFNPKPVASDGVLGDVSAVEIVNDNMPFLGRLGDERVAGASVDLRLVLHPVLWVTRDGNGHLFEVHGHQRPEGDESAIRESVILFHVEQMDSVSDRDALEEGIHAVLRDVRVAVRDWKAMRHRVNQVVMGYKSIRPRCRSTSWPKAFSSSTGCWTTISPSLVCATTSSSMMAKAGRWSVSMCPGLGLLSDPDLMVLRKGATFVTHTPELLDFMRRPEPLLVTKANIRSRVHRRTYMDYVGLKTYTDDGTLFGELRIVGLFSATAYTRSTRNIPYLRRKADQVMERSGYDPDSHSGRALNNVLESYPRDELFQLDLETLHRFANAILQLGERPRVRVLSRIDKFDRFVSALVFVPRERYSTNTRIRIGEWLAEQYQGHVSAWYVAYPEGPLARVHFIIGRAEGETPDIPQERSKKAFRTIVRTWADASVRRCGRARTVCAARFFSAAIRTPSPAPIVRLFPVRWRLMMR